VKVAGLPAEMPRGLLSSGGYYAIVWASSYS
jgi:hypothetical protein